MKKFILCFLLILLSWGLVAAQIMECKQPVPTIADLDAAASAMVAKSKAAQDELKTASDLYGATLVTAEDIEGRCNLVVGMSQKDLDLMGEIEASYATEVAAYSSDVKDGAFAYGQGEFDWWAAGKAREEKNYPAALEAYKSASTHYYEARDYYFSAYGHAWTADYLLGLADAVLKKYE